MTLIDSIRNDPKFSPHNSQKWFIGKIKDLTGKSSISSLDMLGMHQSRLTTKIMPGNMYNFVYDPKHKKKLPLYDKFPLVIPFGKDIDSFIGLNLHYLKPSRRMVLLNDLMQFAKNNRYGEVQKLKMQWDYISNASKFPDVAVCVKRYLNGYVKSRFMQVDPKEWPLAVMLPTENWAKGKPY